MDALQPLLEVWVTSFDAVSSWHVQAYPMQMIRMIRVSQAQNMVVSALLTCLTLWTLWGVDDELGLLGAGPACFRLVRFFHCVRLTLFVSSVSLGGVLRVNLGFASRGDRRRVVVERLVRVTQTCWWRLLRVCSAGIVILNLFAVAVLGKCSGRGFWLWLEDDSGYLRNADRVTRRLFALMLACNIFFVVHNFARLGRQLFVDHRTFGGVCPCSEVWIRRIMAADQAVFDNVQAPREKHATVERHTVVVSFDPAEARCASLREDSCSICMSAFEAGAGVRLLNCRHGFHSACVDAWLEQRLTCPVCLCGIDEPPAIVNADVAH